MLMAFNEEVSTVQIENRKRFDHNFGLDVGGGSKEPKGISIFFRYYFLLFFLPVGVWPAVAGAQTTV